MIIYQIFPTLAGPFTKWVPHLERAAAMGFDWVFVNPIQRPGESGSLYSIVDYHDLNPLLIDSGSRKSPREQLAGMLKHAEKLGLKVMVDLVIDHTAHDSPLTRQHPAWYRRENGEIVHPGAMEKGEKVVWGDLAALDWEHSSGAEGLFLYFQEVVEWLLNLGFQGFRCDAAYQVPKNVWERLIRETRRRHPGTVFVAETLGNPPDLTRRTAEAGFDFIFNSGKWWDFDKDWLMEQYNLTRATCPSIGFPESHDTDRLAAECGGNEALLRQRYFFAAFFSGGVLMPIGYEFGFRRRLHVVKTRPEDWEEPQLDLTDFIRKTNAVKSRYPVFGEDAPTHVIRHDGDGSVLVLWKGSTVTRQEALVVLNKDPLHESHYRRETLRDLVQSGQPLECVSPENPMAYVPQPFVYDLRPGEGLVFVTER